MSLTKVKTLAAVILACLLATSIVLVGHTPAAPAEPGKELPASGKDDKRDQAKKAEASKGEPKKEDLPLIRKIIIAGSGGVSLRQTGKETLNGVAVALDDLKDGVLELRGAEAVEIEFKELPELVIGASGSVTGKDIKAKRAVITIVGSGETRLSGTADDQRIINDGSGLFNGRELKGKEATISVRGSADVIVNVSDSLKLNIGGSGSIRYLGSPNVEALISGSGFIVPHKDK